MEIFRVERRFFKTHNDIKYIQMHIKLGNNKNLDNRVINDITLFEKLNTLQYFIKKNCKIYFVGTPKYIFEQRLFASTERH